MNSSKTSQVNHNGPAIVFTDMDGTLLDHDDYSWHPVKDVLIKLEQHNIPVIFNTSKTRAELEYWKNETGNRHPFIVENGSAIFIPSNYPNRQAKENDYTIIKLGVERSIILRWLDHHCSNFKGDYLNFATLNVNQLIELTDLPKQQAELALQREYSEALQWTGTPEAKDEFIQHAINSGFKILIGGRFLHILGKTDKGSASQILFDRLKEQLQGKTSNLSKPTRVYSVACGDSDNDIDMLEWADVAILIRSKNRDFPLVNNKATRRSVAFGPQGLAEELNSLFFK